MLAHSGAPTPSRHPFPKVSGFFDALLAHPYASSDATDAPRPGREPMPIPVIAPRVRAPLIDHNSRKLTLRFSFFSSLKS